MKAYLAAACLAFSASFAATASDDSIWVFLAVAFFGFFIIMVATVFQPYIDKIKEATDKIVSALEAREKR